ncbi:MAG: carboxypeptidase regulatory-like domain-containing protein [Planctomycetota bacterium]
MQKHGSVLMLAVVVTAAAIAALAWFVLRGDAPPRATGASDTVSPSPAGVPPAVGRAPRGEVPAVAQAAPRQDEKAARVAIGTRKVEGRVEARRGAGIPDLQVKLLCEKPLATLLRFDGDLPAVAAPQPLAQALSAAGGAFEIGPIPSRPFYLHAEGGGYVQDRHQLYDPDRLDEEPIVLRVERGATLEGVVRAEGRPVPDAVVTLGNEADLVRAAGLEEEDLVKALDGTGNGERERDLRRGLDRARPKLETTTDAHGEFRFGPIPSNRGGLLTVAADGHALYRQANPQLRDGKTVRVVIDLEPGGTIAGKVLGAGAPLAGARVHLLRSDKLIQGLLTGGFHYDLVTTAADGSYLLSHVPSGHYRLEARAPGWPAQARSGIDVARGQAVSDVDFALEPGLTLAGRVTLPDGRPATQARVRAFKKPTPFDLLSFMNPMRAATVTPGADGRFVVSGLAPGTHVVTATSSKLAGATVEAEPGRSDVLLELKAGGGVKGVVVNTAGAVVSRYHLAILGERDAEARPPGLNMSFDTPRDLAFDPDGARRSVSEDVDDPRGEFQIDDLRPGKVRVEIRADGYAPATSPLVEVRSGEISRGVTVFLSPEAIIEGIVRDKRSGEPLANASVRAAPTGGERTPQRPRAEFGPPRRGRDAGARSDRTDEAGRFRISGLAQGIAEVSATRDSYVRSETVKVDVATGKVQGGVLLELERGGNVAGIVYAPSGTPKKGAVILASKTVQITEAMEHEPAITDSQGQFELKNLPPGPLNLLLVQGDVELNVTSVLSMLGKRQVIPVQIAAGETTQVEIHEQGALEQGCRVFGVVRSGEHPLPSALVAAMPEQLASLERTGMRTATTDENGNYELAALPAGRYRFSMLGSDGKESGAMPVDVPAEREARRDLSVPRGAIAGVVSDATTGKPIEGAALQLQADGVANETLYLQLALEARANRGFSDASGRFEIRGVAPGTYQLRAGGLASRGDAREYSVATVRDVVVDGTHAATADVALTRGAVVTGRVTDQKRMPIADVRIFLRSPDGDPVDFSNGVRTDGDGRYRYTALPAGRFVLYAHWDNEVVEAAEPFEVKDGASLTRDFTLQRGVPVTVRLTDIPLVELLDYDVEARDAAGNVYRRMITREQLARFLFGNTKPGEYRLGPFPPGTYSIVVKKQGAIVTSQSATLADPNGETFEIGASGIRKM